MISLSDFKSYNSTVSLGQPSGGMSSATSTWLIYQQNTSSHGTLHMLATTALSSTKLKF